MKEIILWGGIAFVLLVVLFFTAKKTAKGLRAPPPSSKEP